MNTKEGDYMDKSNIGNRLREIRKERDLSQDMVVKEVNEKFGVNLSKGQLSKWERNIGHPVLDDNLVSLVKYYNISLDYIVGRTDKKTPPHLM